MALPTYHAHTTFCDGRDSAEDMVKAAIKLGLSEIGFSGHAPMPFANNWCMTKDDVRAYFKTVTALKEKYKDKIRIFVGVEFDAYSSPSDIPYDYVIGSVHHVLKDGTYLTVDESMEATRHNIINYYGGDAYSYVEDYYDTVSKLYEATHCDIIGHFDLVTKFIDVDPLFSEEHPRYIYAREYALSSLLKTPAVFEVNTGGIYRGYRNVTFPSVDFAGEIYNRGGKLVINSDTHNTNSIDFMLSDVAATFDNLNISYITSLSEILALTRR